MPSFNLTAIAASLKSLSAPRSLLPALHVRDIRCIDWKELRRNGFVGVVIDKDNCITKPYHDQLIPELEHAWRSCLSTFGNLRVLLVSNSAGTADDPALIQAESVARHLGVPVLVHATKKPGQQVVRAIEQYFTMDRRRVPVIYPPSQFTFEPLMNRSDPLKLVVIGDRVTTDIILASRLQAHLQRKQATSASAESNPVYSVLTQEIWQKEKLGTRFMRWAENRALTLVKEYSTRTATISKTGPPSSSSQLPNLKTSPGMLLKRSEQALTYLSQVLLRPEEAKRHLQRRYDSISAMLRELSHQSPSTIVRNLVGITQALLSSQLGKLAARCRKAWLEVKMTLRQYLTTAFENLRNEAVQALVRSANKLQLKLQSSNRIDPTRLGFKTPLLIQHLSKWKQLK